MSINTIKRRIANSNKESEQPDWVSAKNLSLAAFNSINQLKVERLNYIAIHNKVNDYKKKRLYQIYASEIARLIGSATTTLISTSAYSVALKNYLDDVNLELNNEKVKKLKTHSKTLSAGVKQRKKDELLSELQYTKFELQRLKHANALEQAQQVLSTLSLPIKQKLGISI